ncbi:MAG: tRNA (guanosine(37)-N1)-methyltransferase TrmD [Parcubacteria group bacterium]|jgi:tRNA (guanine37-N1)-methyltransferase|nr:tRNA (guanosine(37)-N1)-methyltransferase TrmD [Parcubacteria group bacterium]HCX45414.1 tRNA (guanosine(37)-N1)-methyltransferase TrmD [Patescibacteria group bacterium]|tara:strand:- start:1378 stop:2064 length:687 start_codon:yes stop_codon:yes gene_type:complete
MKQFDIVTIFPGIFSAKGGPASGGDSCCYFDYGIMRQAIKKKLIKINIHDLRKSTTDKHHTVDDRPYGGGPGMILMVEPIVKMLKSIKKKKKTRVIMLAPEGKKFDQRQAERLAKYDQLILLCGRYEGFDARVEKYIDEKVSIGDYVLAGGELAAMVVTEAVARHVPGVVGHEHALDDETFSHDLDYIEYPQYSRPESYKGQKVPKILLSGNHAEIKKWRQSKRKKRK